MKKLLLTCCVIISATLTYAQEHMTFKGIPMDGNLTSFVSQLKANGYTELLTQEDAVVLSGNFAGKDDCTVYVLGTNRGELVWKVVVKFPECVSWYSLKSEYNTFKTSYTNKYGAPESYEYFSDPYYEGDGYELQALRLEKCRYVSYFTTSLGIIMLEIGDDKCVTVVYEDAINVELKKSEKNRAVSSDI